MFCPKRRYYTSYLNYVQIIIEGSGPELAHNDMLEKDFVRLMAIAARIFSDSSCYEPTNMPVHSVGLRLINYLIKHIAKRAYSQIFSA